MKSALLEIVILRIRKLDLFYKNFKHIFAQPSARGSPDGEA